MSCEAQTEPNQKCLVFCILHHGAKRGNKCWVCFIWFNEEVFGSTHISQPVLLCVSSVVEVLTCFWFVCAPSEILQSLMSLFWFVGLNEVCSNYCVIISLTSRLTDSILKLILRGPRSQQGQISDLLQYFPSCL